MKKGQGKQASKQDKNKIKNKEKETCFNEWVDRNQEILDREERTKE